MQNKISSYITKQPLLFCGNLKGVFVQEQEDSI